MRESAGWGGAERASRHAEEADRLVDWAVRAALAAAPALLLWGGPSGLAALAQPDRVHEPTRR